MALRDEMRPSGLHRAHRPAEVHAPIVIEISKSGVLEWLASADTSVVHEKIDSAEMLDGHRDQVTATFRGGNIAVIRGSQEIALRAPDLPIGATTPDQAFGAASGPSGGRVSAKHASPKMNQRVASILVVQPSWPRSDCNSAGS